MYICKVCGNLVNYVSGTREHCTWPLNILAYQMKRKYNKRIVIFLQLPWCDVVKLRVKLPFSSCVWQSCLYIDCSYYRLFLGLVSSYATLQNWSKPVQTGIPASRWLCTRKRKRRTRSWPRTGATWKSSTRTLACENEPEPVFSSKVEPVCLRKAQALKNEVSC